jgi:ElaB/YqjD/DUF883 family membrane-anchored ribosome-binding protein
MEDQSESILNDMEETRSSLTEKLEVLEGKVAETVQPMKAAVERATEAAADIVEEVKETVHEVKEKVRDTAQGVSEAFNLRRQTERHPWIVVGLATTAGCVLANLVGRRTQEPSRLSEPSRPRHGKGAGNGRVHRADSRTATGQETGGLFSEELHRLKGLAISAAMGVLRDIAKRSLPGSLGNRLAEELDNLTTGFGAEPIPEPVFDTSSQDRREPSNGDRPTQDVNGLRSQRRAADN